MTSHKTGTRQEWLAARVDLLQAEKELTQLSDAVAKRRQALPWVRIDREYRFETDEGATYRREQAGMSAFALDDGVVYHTYSAYSRGLDGLWSMYQWFDRAPLGRNETSFWLRRHDEYDAQ